MFVLVIKVSRKPSEIYFFMQFLMIAVCIQSRLGQKMYLRFEEKLKDLMSKIVKSLNILSRYVKLRIWLGLE